MDTQPTDQKKLLSVIVPVYNAESTLQHALDSFLAMPGVSRGRCEIVAVDDGSTDGSASILNMASADTHIPDLVILHQANRGSGAARNTGLARSSAPWVLFLDADDELAFDPVPYIEKHPESSALAFAVEFRKQGRRVGALRPCHVSRKNHLDVFTAANPFPISALVVKRAAIVRPFEPDFLWAEDWLFWLHNPEVFNGLTVFGNVTASVINVHAANKSCNPNLHGQYRSRAAGNVLSELDARLSVRQRNNLMIQASIGRIQQGLRAPLTTYLRLPCAPLLYFKLFLYATGIERCLRMFRQ